MASWKDLVVGTLKLADEVEHLNKEISNLESHVFDIDKRVVRLETIVEIAKIKQISKD